MSLYLVMAALCIVIAVFAAIIVLKMFRKKAKRLAQIKCENVVKLNRAKRLMREVRFALEEVRDLDRYFSSIFEDAMLCIARREIETIDGIIGKIHAMNESDPRVAHALLEMSGFGKILRGKKEMLMRIRMSNSSFENVDDVFEETEYVVSSRFSGDN